MRLLPLLLLAALAFPAAAAEGPASNPLHRLPVYAGDEAGGAFERGGSGTPIGPTRVATVQHVARKGFLLLHSYFYPPKPPGQIEVAGWPAEQLSFSTTDEEAVVLSIREPLASWLGTARATTGTAWVLLGDSVEEILIENLETQFFSGWGPVPGVSGSAVVQRRGADWVVVGVVRARFCHLCPACLALQRAGSGWSCHCESGAYSRIPEGWVGAVGSRP